jgi:hypothetical protein
MIVTWLEIGLWLSLATYLIIWRIDVRRRQAQAWERLVEQLQPQEVALGLQFQFSLGEETVTPEERLQRVRGAHSLWSMYENARIMLDMATYAVANSADVDSELLEALRRDAMQIRVCVMAELSRHNYSQIREGIGGNLARATVAYSDMVNRMTDLLEENRGMLVPGAIPAL